MKTLITAVIFLFAVSTTYAAPFSYELSLDYSESDTDIIDSDTLAFQGTYYFSPVSESRVPLAEAAFAARAGSVGLGYKRLSTDANLAFIAEPLVIMGPAPMLPTNFDPLSVPFNDTAMTFPAFFPSPESDRDFWNLNARYVTPTGWIGGLDYSRSSESQSSVTSFLTSTLKTTESRVSINVGKYIGELTTVTFAYSDGSTEFDIDSGFTGTPPTTGGSTPALIAPPSRSSSDADISEYTLTARTLRAHGDYHHALQASIGYDVVENRSSVEFLGSTAPAVTFSDKSYALRTGVAYDFYPRTDLGIGFGYTVIDAEFGTDKVLDLSVEWFAMPNLAFRASYLSSDASNSFNDTDGFAIGVSGRL